MTAVVRLPAYRPYRCAIRLHSLQLPIVLYIVGFAAALVTSVVATYTVRERARRTLLFDNQEDRKVHRGDIPRLGGVAVFVASAVGLSSIFAFFGPSVLGTWSNGLPV